MGVAEEEAESVACHAGGAGSRGGGGAEQTVDAGADDARRAEAEARGGGGDDAERGAVGKQQRRQRPLQRRACRHGQELADHCWLLTTYLLCSREANAEDETEACELWRRRKKPLLDAGGIVGEDFDDRLLVEPGREGKGRKGLR